MDQNNGAAQDELQAAINSITNGAAGGADSSASVVAELENKIAEEAPAMPEMAAAPAPAPEPTPAPEPAASAAPAITKTAIIEASESKAMYGDPDLDRVKINALNDIRPILESVEIPAEKKFLIYKDIIELTDDKGCIELAYNAAKNITEDKTRAESLLYIIELIDDLGIKMPKE